MPFFTNKHFEANQKKIKTRSNLPLLEKESPTSQRIISLPANSRARMTFELSSTV